MADFIRTQPIPDQSENREHQSDYAPKSIKNRHLSEPNTYIRTGTTTGRPTIGSDIKLGADFFGTAVWFDYQTSKLWIWNPALKAWRSIQLV